MTIPAGDLERIKSLIFETVARADKFGDLIHHSDTLMRAARPEALDGLTSAFEDATDVTTHRAAVGQGAHEVRFSFDKKGHVITGTASAIAAFGLEPGESVQSRLGDSGQIVLDDLLRGRRSQASFTIFAKPRLRPVPVLAQANMQGGFDAIAMNVLWSSAIAPLLKDGFQLTDAEVDVTELLFRGHSPKDIARQRARAFETVRTQLRTICRKMDARGNMELVHLIYGLIATSQQMRAEHASEAHGTYMLDLPSGRRMDVEVTGPEAGRPMLFLHGCLGGRRLPEAALHQLRNHRIIAPGRPGHGQTPGDPLSSVQDVCRDVLSVLDYFNVGQTDVLSYDLGAPYALWLAALAPERCASVLCLAPVPPLDRWSDILSLPSETRVFAALARVNPAAARYLALLGGQRILRKGPEGFGRIVFNNSAVDREFVDADAASQRMYWHGHAWHVEQGPDGFLADAGLSSRSWDRDLPRLLMPVRFLLGEHDRNTPATAVRRLADRTGAEVNVAPSEGHSILHVRPHVWASHLPDANSPPERP